jgi:hypothetical protein
MSALTFGGATSDRVTCGSGSNLDDLSTLTICVAAYPTTHTSGRKLCWKGEVQFELNTTHGASNLLFYRGRATTNTLYRTNDSRATTGGWHFFAATFDSGATPQVRIYECSPAGAVTECTYGTNTNGTGALNTDAAANWHWANDVFVGSALQGDMSHGQVYNRVLSVSELSTIKTTWKKLDGCVLYTKFGENGTGTQRDETGTGGSGTVTGATLQSTRSYPVNPFWGSARGKTWTTAAAAASNRIFQDRRRRFIGSMSGRP